MQPGAECPVHGSNLWESDSRWPRRYCVAEGWLWRPGRCVLERHASASERLNQFINVIEFRERVKYCNGLAQAGTGRQMKNPR